MVKRLSALLLALALLAICCAAAAESEERPLVRDELNYYTDSEIGEMEAIIRRIQSRYQVDVTVLTTYEVEEGPTRLTVAYADKYYEDNGYGLGSDRAGVVFILDMTNRFNYLSTAGVMIDYLTDGRVEDILDAADPYLYSGNYGQAMLAELRQTEAFLAQGREEGSFRYDAETGERLTGLYNALTRNEMLVAIGVGAVTALIIILSVRGNYQLKGSTYRYDVAGNSQRSLRVDTETFLRESVSRQRIVRSTGSSGGSGGGGHSSHSSSVHISSGGMSHGGGGHHF